MGVVRYYQLPDQATQDAIRARGDTIEIIPRESASGPQAPAGSPLSNYNPTFEQNPSMTNLLPDGTTVTSAGNPSQFATTATTQQLSNLTGLNGYNLANQFQGGSMTDWNFLSNGNQTLNAGLLAENFRRYPDAFNADGSVNPNSAAWYAVRNSMEGYSPLQGSGTTAAPTQISSPQAPQQRQQPGGTQYSTNPTLATQSTQQPISRLGRDSMGTSSISRTSGDGGTRVGSGTYTDPSAYYASLGITDMFGSRDGRTGRNTLTDVGTFAPEPGWENQQPNAPYGTAPRAPVANPFLGGTDGRRDYLMPGSTPPSGGGTTPPPGGGQQPGGTPPPGGYHPPPGGYNPYPPYGGTGYGTPPINTNGFGTNYGYPPESLARYFTSGEDLQYKAENDRNFAYGRGDSIDSDLLAYIQHQNQRGVGYEGAANDQYGRIARGEAGYTPGERDSIARLQELYGLQITPEQMESNYLTGDEISNYYGNPYEATDRVREGLALNAGNIGELRDRTRETLGSQDRYTRDALARRGENVGAALDSGESSAMGTINRDRLTASQDFLDNYKFTPADEAAIVEQAGRGVGYSTAANIERIRQDAAARGSYSPLSTAAALDRQRQTGDVAGANAMSDARIGARRLGLDTTMGREQTRLDAERGYSGLASNAALQLGGRRVAAAQNTGDVNLANEQYVHGARLAGEQNLSREALANQRWGTDLATDAWRQAERSQSDRAMGAATNRQGVNQYNQAQQYGRGMDIYGAARSANQTFADRRLDQEGELRNYLGGMQNQANQNVSVGLQQRIGNFGQQTGAASNATRNAISNHAVPDTGFSWRDVFADGGVVKGPKTALVGEAGPELVVDLKKWKPGMEIANMGYLTEEDMPMGGGYLEEADYSAPQGSGPPYQPIQRENPFYKKLLGAMLSQQPQQGGMVPQQQQQGAGGGLIGAAAKLAGLFMADGGVVEPQSVPSQAQGTPQRPQGPQIQMPRPQGQNAAPRLQGGAAANGMPAQAQGAPQGRPFQSQPFNMPAQAQGSPQGGPMLQTGTQRPAGMLPPPQQAAVPAQPQAKQIAPGVEWVNGPQVRTLGNQPQAVVPLTARPDAKVTPADLPMLAARYQGQGRPQGVGNGRPSFAGNGGRFGGRPQFAQGGMRQ